MSRNYTQAFRALLLIVSLFTVAASAQSLLNGSVAVPAGNHWYNSFFIEREAQIVGRFTTQGGGSNDIYAFIVDADGYQNLKNGNQFLSYYQSGRVTVANINVRLASGNYYLVFSNRHAILSPKTVYGTVDIVQSAAEPVRNSSVVTERGNVTDQCEVVSAKMQYVVARRDCDKKNCSTNKSTIYKRIPIGELVGIRPRPHIRSGRITWVPIYHDFENIWIAKSALSTTCSVYE